jgi:hypothetical protein
MADGARGERVCVRTIADSIFVPKRVLMYVPARCPGLEWVSLLFKDFRPGQKAADYSGQSVSARNVVSTLLLGKKVNTLMQVVVKTQLVDTQIRVEEMVDPLQKVNVHRTIWTAGRRYWRKLE